MRIVLNVSKNDKSSKSAISVGPYVAGLEKFHCSCYTPRNEVVWV